MSTETTVPPSPTKTTQTKADVSAIPLSGDQSSDSAIRPLKFHASDEELADLKRRITATRWPERETVDDRTQGVQLAASQALAQYWANNYDWRPCEARLDPFPPAASDVIAKKRMLHGRPAHPRSRPWPRTCHLFTPQGPQDSPLVVSYQRRIIRWTLDRR